MKSEKSVQDVMKRGEKSVQYVMAKFMALKMTR